MFADADRAGLGIELERATLSDALKASRDLPEGRWLSVNASPEMILAGDVLSGILRDRARPIVLEITEHQPIGDYAAIREAVAALGADVKPSVDDVGAGVANFSDLVELRPDFLKVDASLVRGLHADVTRQALIVGLRHFALATNTLIIAEGSRPRLSEMR